MTGFRHALLLPAVACLLALAAGSVAANDVALRPRPDATAIRIGTVPEVDGNVLDDPVWQDVPALDGFWQTTPHEGEPASERTEVRVAYSPDTLFVAVVCFDREPAGIVVAGARRDGPLEDTDSFRLVLDTYRDRQNGFVFGTNPNGLEYDGQVTNEGQGGSVVMGGQQIGSGGGFNLNWDGSWVVRTAVGEYGWSAEFAIPFRTLRYAGGPGQVWGVNFQRTIRRRNETAYWAPLPRQFSLLRLSQAGSLSGLDIAPQRNLKVTPYTLGNTTHAGVSSGRTVSRADAGVDAKYSVTPALTLDATLYTDFAQVEVDEQQINLDRFNLFYPEKRPFFLENAGIFSVGSPSEVEIFFSRRIGIGPDGEVIPILAGGRLSGQAGGVNVGLLNMQTGSVGELPSNNFSVVRLRKDLRNRSSVGGAFVNRSATGDRARDGDTNQTFALDGRIGLGRYARVSAWVAGTRTPGLEGETGAWEISAERDTPGLLLTATVTDVGRHFNPEVGFLARDGGFRRAEALIFRRFRPADAWGLLEVRPHVSYRGYWDADGRHQTGFLHIDNHLEWRNGYELHTGINVTREGVLEPFEIYPGVDVPSGRFDNEEAQIVFNTNQGAPVSFAMRLTAGGFFDGERVALTPSLRVRVGTAFSSALSLSRNDVDLRAGSFVTNLLRARIGYSFSPRLFVQGLLQYNDRAEIWSTNLRLGWLQQANTGLFVVYNDLHPLAGFAYDPLDRRGTDRSLILKYSRMFDLLD